MDAALSPSVVLAAYAEPLLDGRRVVVFGDATTDLGLELVERGARSVHVYDPDPARAALAASQNRTKEITVVPLDAADIAVRDGAFDVALVPDLSGISAADTLLRRVRRALSPRGTALIASPNPDVRFTLTPHTSASRRDEPLGYYELYDTVSAVFSEVRMFGQTPFVGYAIVDFAPGDDPEVSLDSGLLPTGAEEPEWFVALASNDATRDETDAYSIVQLPAARVLRHGQAQAGTAETESALRAARGREAELVERISALEADKSAAEQTHARLATALSDLESRDRRIAELERDAARTATLESDLTARAARIGELESKILEEGARASHATTEMELLRKRQSEDAASLSSITTLTREKSDLATRVKQLESDKEQLARELATAMAQETVAQKALLDRDADKAKLEQKLTAAEGRLTKLTAVADEAGPDDVARLEAALGERAGHLRKLEKDLRETERVGRELVRELKTRETAAQTRVLGHDDGQALGQENARLRADLEALSWTIQELEGRLSRVSGAGAR